VTQSSGKANAHGSQGERALYNQHLKANRYDAFQIAYMNTKPFICNGYKKCGGVAQALVAW
jgi:hypothetical protein